MTHVSDDGGGGGGDGGNNDDSARSFILLNFLDHSCVFVSKICGVIPW